MSATFFGFNPPFFGGPENILSRQEDERLIKNDLLQLLLTVPGERIMRPSYGVRLRSFVFEQSDLSSIQSLELEIRNQIASFEPRVIVRDLILEPAENGLDIRLIFSLRIDPQKQIIIERFVNSLEGL